MARGRQKKVVNKIELSNVKLAKANRRVYQEDELEKTTAEIEQNETSLADLVSTKAVELARAVVMITPPNSNSTRDGKQISAPRMVDIQKSAAQKVNFEEKAANASSNQPIEHGGAQRQLDLVQASNEGKSWANLFTGNTLASKGMKLQFIAPIIKDGVKTVQLDKVEVERETEKWKSAMILYVVGDSPTIGAVERFIVSQGNYATKSKIYYHNDGYFVERFQSINGRDAVMFSGPCMINYKPVARHTFVC